MLNLIDDASASAATRQLDGAEPQHESAARRPRHSRALPDTPSVTASADPAHLIPVSEVLVSDVPVSEVLVSDVPVSEVLVSEVPVSEVLVSEVPVSEVRVSEVLASESTGGGRHRRPGVPVDGVLAHEIEGPEVLAPSALPVSGRHRRPGVPVAVDWAHPIAAPEISAPTVPVASDPRRSDGRVASGLRRFRVSAHVPAHQLVLLGILVLLVAVAAVLGVRGSGALATAQPKADAASSHSVTVTVPGGR